MITPKPPANESQRIQALRDYQILDTAAEKEFDELVQLAAQICEVPISLVSLIDTDRQWFKAKVGLEADETHRDLAFCAHAIHSDDMLVVEDATDDERFSGNPLVKTDPKIRFYAGKPLINPEGYRLGTLCAIDLVPRKLTKEQQFALEILSKQVVKLLEIRLKNIRHKETIKQLQKTSNELQSFLDDSSDLIQSVDDSGNYLYVNQAWCNALGYSREEALQLNIFDVIHPSLHAHCQQQFSQLISHTQESMIIDVIFKSKNGEDIVVEGNVNALMKENRKILTRGIFRDVTAKKLSEKELKRTRELLEQTNRVALVGGWEVDLLNQQVYWTEMTRRIHEVDDTFVPELEKGIAFYKEGYSRDTISRVFSEAVEQGKSYDVELQIVTHSGKVKWVRAMGIPEFVEGKCTRVYGTFQDIDQQKEDEAHLRLLESVVTNIKDAIVITEAEPFDQPGPKIIYVNEAFSRMTGYSREELIGQNPRMLQGEETDRQELDKVRKALENWQPFEADLINYKKNGEKFWVNMSVVPLANKEGWFTHWIAIERDISLQKDSEQKLIAAKAQAETASLAKSEFLANMSHEIRTPLNSVIGFTDLLVKTPLDDSQRNYMQSVHHSANVLLELINDILDFSKIEAGKLELAEEKTDLWELVNQVTEVIKHKVDTEKIELLAHVDPRLPRYAYLDPTRIRQILINLLGNATKFTESGEIELSVMFKSTPDKSGQAEVMFSVRDTGIGIRPEKQKEIFKAFSQEDGSTTRKFGGTGLGLTISNQLLKLMGDQLGLESEPGKGSRFFFTLSLECEEGDPRQEEKMDTFKKVLVVDDHPRNLEIIRQMLAIRQIDCATASNGIEALEYIKNEPGFDLMIVDYHMPYLNGVQVVEQVRKNLRYNSLPIMLLHSSEEDAMINKACQEFNIQKSISKPITTHKLFGTMASLQAPAREWQPEDIEETSDEKVTILVADDNHMNRMVAQAMITKILPEAQIFFAEDGLQAVDSYQQYQPDIILMDVQMPGMSGYEASQKIRELNNSDDTIIVAFTAGTVKGERERCLEAGMNDYISKPIVLEKLREVLQKWMNQRPVSESETVTTPLPEDRKRFDRGTFEQYYEKNTHLMELIMTEFIKQLDEFEEAIKVQQQDVDIETLKKVSHKLRGSASATHMQKLINLTLQIEDDATDPRELDKLLEELMAEIREAQSISRDFVTSV